MHQLTEAQCEAISGGGYSLVLPNIDLGVITPVNVGTAIGLLDGQATVDQGNTASIQSTIMQLLGGWG